MTQRGCRYGWLGLTRGSEWDLLIQRNQAASGTGEAGEPEDILSGDQRASGT